MKEKKPSVENAIDLMFSSFSFQLVNTYLFLFLWDTIQKDIKKTKKSLNLTQLEATLLLGKEYFYIENCYWANLQRENTKNKNIFLPKVLDTNSLKVIVKQIIKSIYSSVKIKVSNDKITDITKKVFNKISLKTILPLLEKNHVPPLSTDDVYKSYIIKSKDSDLTTDFYLYRKNDTISKFPIEYLVNSFALQNVGEQLLYMQLRQKVSKKYLRILKKRYTYKKEYFNNAVFCLLTYYNLIGVLKGDLRLFEEKPIIKNEKLKNLYDNSVELIGNPLNSDKYFGIYPEIEQYFGSLGSFYDFVPENGSYSIYLPISYIFIENTIEKVEKWLSSKKDLTFIIWFPTAFEGISENKLYGLDDALLINAFENLLPKLKHSKYKKDMFYYISDKKASNMDNTHIVFILSSVK